MNRYLSRLRSSVPPAFLLAALLMLCAATTRAQTTVAAAPTKLNLLYIGIDNPVSVAASGGQDDNTTVSITGGAATVTKTGAGQYNVRVTELTDNCVMNIYVAGKLAGTSQFRVRHLPTPSGTIGGFFSGANVMASRMQEQQGVGVYIKDFPLDVRYQVVGYTVTMDSDKGEAKAFDNEGAQFSAAVKGFLAENAKAGRTLTVDNLRVRDQGGKEWKVPALVYFLK